MSGGVSAGTIASYAAAAGAVISAGSTLYTMAKGTPDAPKAPALKAPDPLKQEAQAPDAGGIKKNIASTFAGAGQSSTQLTGLDGIAPSGLNLGKSTLLGQ